MKSIIIALCALTMCGSLAHAQKLTADKVPAPVMAAFKAKFATAAKVEWKLEDKTEYEAEFHIGAVEHSAAFDAAGKWLETETEIKTAELPVAVNQTLTKDFATYKVKEANKVESPDKGNFYEVDLVKGNEKLEVQLSATGAVLNKKVEKKGDKD